MTLNGGSPSWISCQDEHTVLVRVRLTPNGRANQIGSVVSRGDDRQMLSASVTAAPEKGRANKALEKLMAKAIGVAPTHVEVVAGRKERVKTLKLNGDAEQIAQSLTKLPN